MEFLSSAVSLPLLRSELVRRRRLEARLDVALATRKLVMLTAPAGYGKTVVLAQRLRELPAGHAVAWLSLGEDDDLPRLLTHLLSALDAFDLPWRISPAALPLLALREGDPSAVAGELAHALEHGEAIRGVIAFDDVHRIADRRVFDFFERLLARLPANWTVAMTSRADPPLPLARMMLAGDLCEIRQDDLRFEREDVRALLESARQPAGDEVVDLLLRRTEGWAAGLNMELLAQRMPRADSRAKWRRFEYLAQEVLEELPPPMQEFLLRCSVLPELSAARCAHVSGDKQAARWLDEIERLGLFVTVLEGEELRLRLHDIFREFLSEELGRRFSEDLPELMRRAAEGEADVVLCVNYLLRAGDAQQAAQRMLESAAKVIHSGGGEQLMRLIQRFPEPLRATAPELAFVQGLYFYSVLQYKAMQASMRQAMEGFESRGQWRWATLSRALASIALFFGGRPAEAFALWGESPRSEPGPETEGCSVMLDLVRSQFFGPYRSTPDTVWQLVRVLPFIDVESWTPFLFTRHGLVGRWGVRAPMQALADTLSSLAGESRPHLKLTALQLQAWLSLWQGDIERVRELSRELASESRWLGDPPYVQHSAGLLKGFERTLSGDFAQAKAMAPAVLRQDAFHATFRVHIHNYMAAQAVASDDWTAVREALASIEKEPFLPSWPCLRPQTAAARAALALHEGRDSEAAAALLRPMLEHVMDWDNHGINAQLRVTLARAELRCGHRLAAWEALEPALRMAMDAGEPLGLLLCGSTALQELANASWPDKADAAALEYLRDCVMRARHMRVKDAERTTAATATDPVLSERELQVVELVAQGQSNKLIARSLGISPHTVKRHLARIFEKTGLASRGRLAHRFGVRAA